MDMKYVLSQIDRIGDKGKCNPQIKLSSENGTTNWIDIDWDSIRKIKAVLKIEKE